MSGRTVDWAALRGRPEAGPAPEGLRERKKRQMRQQLTDTATEMFVERGFDQVRVAEIAEACGVSEKTVFNYFPTKEALILDHPEAALDALRAQLADLALSPVQAVLRILAGELGAMIDWLGAQPVPEQAIGNFRRFGALIRSTPSLRAYQRDMLDQLVAVAAEQLAARTGLSAGDPEPQVAAIALLGLWPVQFSAMGRHLDATRTPEQIRLAVTADVERAARLIDAGLSTLAGVQGTAPNATLAPSR
jgi:AcrR family transcriptional regulator